MPNGDGSGTCCQDQCDTLDTDPQNCGFCGFACGPTALCLGGGCVYPVCPADGSGTNTACQFADAGEGTCCGASCVDLSSNDLNCQGCGLACSSGGTCSGGTCYVASCTGVADATPCGTPGLGSSCCAQTCVDTTSSTSDCGFCGFGCPLDSECTQSFCTYVDAGPAVCVTSADCPSGTNCLPSFGQCTIATCTTVNENEPCAFTDAGGGICCNRVCADTTSDSSNCNGCGLTCANGCVGSFCQPGYEDAGATVGTCSFDGGPQLCDAGACATGFTCSSGSCVLNGADGAAEVILRWGQPEDLDLHVVEPGGCEVWYGNRTCVGTLDLDSNAGCSIDNLDTENVVYPADARALPSGVYTVRVDFYEDCDSTPAVPYEVIVRNNGVTTNYCGEFSAANEDVGGQGGGATVATFTIP